MWSVPHEQSCVPGSNRGHGGEGVARRTTARRRVSAARRGEAAVARVEEGTRPVARIARGAGSAASRGGQPPWRRCRQGSWL
jgi:hypothetical protein